MTLNQKLMNSAKHKEYEKGVAFAALSYIIWGILPVYWKAMAPVSPILIMFYRLVMAFIFVLILAFIFYKPKEILAPLKKKGAAFSFLISGILISVNWGIYIWAVNSGHIIQTSMGYYINPLITVLFGTLFFHEKLSKYKIAALISAGIGVLIMLIGNGEVPIVALSLAVSFACYGAIKKKLNANSLLALLYETAFLAPVALIVIISMEIGNNGLFAYGSTLHFALAGFAGVVTAIPLLLFAAAANRVDLTMIGFVQYISPTITLLLGVFIYHESFDLLKMITFLFIWAGLAIYIFSEIGTKNVNILDT
jgi:chloramphenicol-sensitive protein RarD